MERLLDALAVVDDILEANSSVTADGNGPSEGDSSLFSALERVQDLGPGWNVEVIEDASTGLRSPSTTLRTLVGKRSNASKTRCFHTRNRRHRAR